MKKKSERQVLSDADRQAIRRQLRRRDGTWFQNLLLRIGRPAASEYSDIDWGKHLFGQSLFVLGIFILILFFALPDDDRRWPFIGFAMLTVAVGADQMDKARRKSRKRAPRRGGDV